MNFNSPADLSEVGRHGPEFDASRYMEAVGDLGLTEAQKVELLSALWNIMRSFVELGASAEISGRALRSAGLLVATSEEDGHE